MEALAPGDEFAYDEYPELRAIQISGSASSKCAGAQHRADDDRTLAREEEIEVFDDAAQFIDIHSVPDDDKERMLLEDFDGDRALALQFVELIKQNAVVRTAFKQHANPEIMARQIIIIGQDTRLLDSLVVIPHVRAPADTFIERLRKSNLQQLVRGHLVRVRRANKSAVPAPSVNIPTQSRAHIPAQTRAQMSGIQFPRAIVATRNASAESNQRIFAAVPPNTTVRIEELVIYPTERYRVNHGIIPSALTYDCIGAQAERPAPPYDPEEEPVGQVVRIGPPSSGETNQYARLYTYLRLLFQQYFFARVCPDLMQEDRARDFESNEEEITVAPNIPAQMIDRLAVLARVLGFALDFSYATNVFCDFSAADAQFAYWRVRYGNELPDVIEAPLRLAYSAREAAIRANTEYRAKLARLEILAKFIDEHFGARATTDGARRILKQDNMSPMIGQVRAIAMRAATEDELFARLNETERKFVLAKYDEFARSANTALADDRGAVCRHRALVSALRSATSLANIKRSLANLTPILDANAASTTTTLIKCALCSQVAICPHVLDIARSSVFGATKQREREIISSYIERVPERKTYYCKVCGEYFAWSLVTAEDDTERANPEDEDIATEIFRELTVIQRYVRAQNVVDQHSLMRTIERHIYPFIEAIASKTALARTSVAAEYIAKIHIFIAIYAFADCIVNLRTLGIIFDGLTLKDPITAMRAEAAAAKYAIDKIMIIENIALSTVPGITREIISANLIAAIGHLRNVAQSMPSEVPQRDFRAALAYDPIYYILYFYGRCGKTLPDVRANVGAKTRANVGAKTHANVGAKTRTNADTKTQTSAPSINYQSGHISAITDQIPAKPANPLNVYEEFASRAKDSDNPVIRAIVRDIIESLKIRAFDYAVETTERPIVEYRARVAANYAKMRAAENVALARHRDERRITTRVIIRPPSALKLFSYLPGKLSAVYDEKGQGHRWDTLIFARESEDIHEVKLGSPDAFIDAMETYIDKKCTVCGLLQSKTDALSEDTIRAALRAREILENFYQFFEQRCPKNGPHEFNAANGAESQCAKCGYSAKLARTQDRAYFDKYEAEFRARIAPPSMLAPLGARRISEIDKAIEQEAREYAAQPWVFNYESLVNAAALFKLERHDIQMLGAREGLTREQLSDESFIARVPKSRTDTRILTLRGYIREIMILYHILQGVARHERAQTYSIAQFIEDIKKQLGVSVVQFEAMTSELPPLGDILHDGASNVSFDLVLSRALDIFADTHKPAEIVDYYLETFCNCLRAFAQPGDNVLARVKAQTELCAIFARAVIARIFARENIMLKGDRYSLSVVEGTKLANDEFDIANMPGTGDYDAYDDERDANIVQDETQDSEDPFSLDAFDIDDARSTDETIDAEDDQTIMHIGNDVGW